MNVCSLIQSHCVAYKTLKFIVRFVYLLDNFQCILFLFVQSFDKQRR